MESAAVNTLSPGDEVLCLAGGKFGERWVKICKAYGMKVHEISLPWGKALDLNVFEEQLKKHSHVKAVFTQACETSTATLFPIQEMARLIQKHSQALVIVDAITAMGCIDLPMDEWGLDIVIAGSQKAFMLPTGLSFIGISKKALKASETSLCPKFYWDWKNELKNYPNSTHFSSPNSMIVALSQVLQLFKNVGMSEVKKRSLALSQATQVGGQLLGLKVFSESPSPSVTALELPSDIQGESLRLWLEENKNITLMGGQDQLKNKILRIGHMGAITNEDLIEFFIALCEGLKKEVPHDLKPKIENILSSSKEFFK